MVLVRDYPIPIPIPPSTRRRHRTATVQASSSQHCPVLGRFWWSFHRTPPAPEGPVPSEVLWPRRASPAPQGHREGNRGFGTGKDQSTTSQEGRAGAGMSPAHGQGVTSDTRRHEGLSLLSPQAGGSLWPAAMGVRNPKESEGGNEFQASGSGRGRKGGTSVSLFKAAGLILMGKVSREMTRKRNRCHYKSAVILYQL